MDKRARDAAAAQKVMDFALRFASLMSRIRRAKDSKTGITLTAGEVETLIEAFQILKEKR